jgi:hypothetical protein
MSYLYTIYCVYSRGAFAIVSLVAFLTNSFQSRMPSGKTPKRTDRCAVGQMWGDKCGDRRDVPRFLHAIEPKEPLGAPHYSIERSQFCSRRPSTLENSFSLSVTIT